MWALAPARVSGDSMLPSLADGDVVLLIRPGLDRLLGGSGGQEPGDVVALVTPYDGALAVKRVESVDPTGVYVLGDNRVPLASRDSRSFGTVPVGSLRGRVVLAAPWWR
ncbi:MAG: S26 family signal peptidase [Trueperaceae bacterium]|nr:S26 family signal peptidase [Trueperaceae bacterium]